MTVTVVARRICATPSRSASEAWAVIMDLLAPVGENAARRELEEIAGIAVGLIADEAMTAPIVVSGSGPRLRIYCLYDDEAMSGEDANESSLAFDATSGDWQMSLPCPTADLTWVRDVLAARSAHIGVRDMLEAADSEAADSNQGGKSAGAPLAPEIAVDREGFFRS